jgi:hypothetical protein
MIESADEFVRLRTSDDRELYRRATSDSAPEAVWLEVIGRYPEMKQWVAHNKTVPLTILELLADDLDPNVRHAVAQKRKLTLKLFAKLAEDSDETVRQRIACNAKVPMAILTQLVDDNSEIVASVARERLSELTE